MFIATDPFHNIAELRRSGMEWLNLDEFCRDWSIPRPMPLLRSLADPARQRGYKYGAPTELLAKNLESGGR